MSTDIEPADNAGEFPTDIRFSLIMSDMRPYGWTVCFLNFVPEFLSARRPS